MVVWLHVLVMCWGCSKQAGGSGAGGGRSSRIHHPLAGYSILLHAKGGCFVPSRPDCTAYSKGVSGRFLYCTDGWWAASQRSTKGYPWNSLVFLRNSNESHRHTKEQLPERCPDSGTRSRAARRAPRGAAAGPRSPRPSFQRGRGTTQPPKKTRKSYSSIPAQ